MTMKPITLLLSGLLLIASASCQEPDLTTDEAVIEFYCHETGADPDEIEGWLCIDRVTDDGKVIVIGNFAYDAGCFIESIIVNGKMGEWQSMSGKALEQMGWDEADNDALLLEFVDAISMAWGGVMEGPNDDFSVAGAPAFTEPSVAHTDDGYTVTFWFSEPSGMEPVNYYTQLAVYFNEKGVITGTEGLASHSVPMRGYEDE